MLAERRVDGDPATKQRRRNFRAQRIGYRKREAAVDLDAVGETSVPSDTCLDDVRAEVLVAMLTWLAPETAPALPADADASTEVEMRDQ